MKRQRVLLAKLLIVMALNLCVSTAVANSCHNLFSTKRNVDEFLSSLQIVSFQETEERFKNYINPNNLRANEGANFLFGFSRDSNGRIVPIIVNSAKARSFGSVRAGVTSGWSSQRSVRIIPLQMKSGGTGVRGKKGNSLSQTELGKLLNEGAFPVTQKTSDQDWTRSDFPEWSVLMYVNGVEKGRTGIVLHHGRPVLIRDSASQMEWLLEAKGIGGPKGGIQRHEHYGYLGGMLPTEVSNEIRHLDLNLRESQVPMTSKVFVAGDVSFSDRTSSGRILSDSNIDSIPMNPPGVLFRWVPGSIRATFVNNASQSAGVVKKENLKQIAYATGRMWGAQIANGQIPFTHPENLIWSEYAEKLYSTDFSDVFSIATLPVIENEIIKSLKFVAATMDSRFELPNYRENASILDELFFEGLSKSLPGHPKLRTTEDAVQFFYKLYGQQIYQFKLKHQPAILLKSALDIADKKRKEILDFYRLGNFLERSPGYQEKSSKLGAAYELARNYFQSRHRDGDTKVQFAIQYIDRIREIFLAHETTFEQKMQALKELTDNFRKANPDLEYVIGFMAPKVDLVNRDWVDFVIEELKLVLPFLDRPAEQAQAETQIRELSELKNRALNQPYLFLK